MKQKINHTEIQKNLFEVSVDFRDLEIDKSEIERTLGYKENGIPQHFSEMIDEIVARLSGMCMARGGYRILEIEVSREKAGGFFIDGILFRTDKIVTSQLKGSEKAALFVATIGTDAEKWSKELMMQGDPVMGYLADTVASVTVEALTDLLHDIIGSEMGKQGLNITNRYSPGYCNWPVSEQHLLFSLLPRDFCGITLNESALMSPVKSVSGIIGIGSGVIRRDYLCDRCGVKDCTYRSKRESNIRPDATKEKLSGG